MLISRLLSQETRRESAPSGTESRPSSARQTICRQTATRSLRSGSSRRASSAVSGPLLHQNVVKIEDQLVGAVLALAQLHVADDKLHAAAVMVFVDLEMERRVHRAARDKAQPTGARSEPDGTQPRPVLGEARAHMAVARKAA